MKLSKFTVIMAVLLMAILTIGAVSAESIGEADDSIAAGGSDLEIAAVDDSAGDLSAAEATDNAVSAENDDDYSGDAVLKDDEKAYEINDDTYSTYFNEDGTPTSVLGELGDYSLIIDNLTQKNIVISSGSNINITGKSYEAGGTGYGFIRGSITIGDGFGSAGSIIISNLEINAENTSAINILDLTTDVTIKNCRFNIIGDSQVDPENPYSSVYAINANGFISDLTIIENDITVSGDAPFSYGIQLGSYGADANPENIVIANNSVDVSVGECMAEAIYVDNPVNVLIEGNNLFVQNEGDFCAYGIQVADSAQYVFYESGYEGTLTSGHDILIKDNYVDVSSEFMVYGITALNFGVDGYDSDMADYGMAMPLCYQFELNTTIVDNTVKANSKKGVMAIGGQIYNMTVINNDITAIGTSAINMTTGDALGNHTSALSVQFNAASAEDDYYIIVKDNNVNTNVLVEELNSEMYSDYVSFENNTNTPVYVIDDESYSTYFNDDGTPKDTLSEDGGYALYIDQIHDKNIVINSGSEITINALTDYTGAVSDDEILANIINGTIYIEASDVTVSGLTIYNENKNAIDIADSSNEINNNDIFVYAEGNAFAYGIQVADSAQYVVGILDGDIISVEGNDIGIEGRDFTTANTSDAIGKANAAIYNADGSNVTAANNTIMEIGPKLINDNTYSQYFDENGKLKEDCTILRDDTLIVDTLTNKKMIIDIPVEIKGTEDNKLVNSTISLVAGADGTTIDGLNMEFTGDNTTGSIGLIYAVGVNDIAITNNNILVPEFVDKDGAKYGSSLYAIEIESGADGCNNVTISGNTIDITGSARYLYGIDVFHTWGDNNERNSNLNISDNNITINGATRMSEAIYVSESDDVVIENNNISATAQGAAYGIATDQLNGSEIKGNTIDAISIGNMAYGITSTTSGTDVTIEDNTVTATGVGAVGVGLSGQDNVNVSGNTININGEDFTSITSVDNLGTANAAILDKDGTNTNVNVGENTMTENGKATDRVMTGNGTKDLQNILDDAEAGSTVDLTGQFFNNVGTVTINKDVAITGGKIIGAEGKAIFEIAPKSQDGPSEVNITGVDFKVNNANTIVKVTAENATGPTSIEVPAINIKDNSIDVANKDVVTESVKVLEIDSERPILSPTNDIAISDNTIAAGVDPFDFKVTSISSGGDTVITPQNISTERKATEIIYEDMNTTAVSPLDPNSGEWFTWRLVDGDGNPVANTPMKIGFNGVIYDEKNGMVTDENGYAKLQINLGYKGDYTFAISFLGNDEYNASFVVAKIKVATQTGSLTVPNRSYAASAKTKALTATFKTKSGKVIANKKISFTVNGKTYTAKTNAKGVATVNVSLNKKGTYNFVAKFAGDSTYTAISKTAKLVIK